MTIRAMLCLALVVIAMPAFAMSDLAIIKARVVEDILAEPINNDQVEDYSRSLNQQGFWSDINYQDLSRSGFENAVHLNRLLAMSIAYKVGQDQDSEQLAEKINHALAHWVTEDYICDNWWENQVFTPTRLADILLLMGEVIPKDIQQRAITIIGRANPTASGVRPGGDRIKITGIIAKRLLILGDKVALAQALETIVNEVRFATGDRGLQADFSFHHRIHRVNNTLSYGQHIPDTFASWAWYTSGTEFSFPAERLALVVDYYLEGITKQRVYGLYKDVGVMNRGISRAQQFGVAPDKIPRRLLKVSDHRRNELQKLVDRMNGADLPAPSFAKFFWQSEHFVVQRPDYYVSVRMHSRRNASMESPYNSEGLKNHHRGDGTAHLSMSAKEYLNVWPVYDWQKIPGTTILQKDRLPPAQQIRKYGLTEMVGAVTDGYQGAVAYDFISPHDLIQARKAWFFFDDEYVCLGAGIETRSSLPVVTTLEQAALNSKVRVKSQGKQTQLRKGQHKLPSVEWVHHNKVAYIFPTAANIKLSNQPETGRWTDINKRWISSPELVTQDMFKLWIDHGPRPEGRIGGLRPGAMLAEDVTYQYMVVPNVEAKNLDTDRGIKILANNRHLQAVQDYRNGVIQAAFYRGGSLVISDGLSIFLDSPGLIMAKLEGGKITALFVADPTRKLSRLHIRVSGKLTPNKGGNITTHFDVKKSETSLSLELPQGDFAGDTLSVKLLK